MAANIFIKSVEMRPNPVYTGAAFTVSVEIGDRLSGLADGDGTFLVDGDGTLLCVPEGALILTDIDNIPLTDLDGVMIETEV